jgi:hypothetical protein
MTDEEKGTDERADLKKAVITFAIIEAVILGLFVLYKILR